MFGAVGGTLIAGLGMAAGAMAGLVGARRLGGDRIAASMGEAEFARLEAMLGRYAPSAIIMLCRPVPVLAGDGAGGGRVPGPPGGLFLPITLSSLGMAAVYAWLGAMAGEEGELPHRLRGLLHPAVRGMARGAGRDGAVAPVKRERTDAAFLNAASTNAG